MKIARIIGTMLAAFLLEWSIAALFAGTLFVPVSALVFCFWIWRLEFEPRMWFALVVGFVMDTMHLIPFGASLLTCLSMALICEGLRFFLSDTESRISQTVGIAALSAVFAGALLWWGWVLHSLA